MLAQPLFRKVLPALGYRQTAHVVHDIIELYGRVEHDSPKRLTRRRWLHRSTGSRLLRRRGAVLLL